MRWIAGAALAVWVAGGVARGVKYGRRSAAYDSAVPIQVPWLALP